MGPTGRGATAPSCPLLQCGVGPRAAPLKKLEDLEEVPKLAESASNLIPVAVCYSYVESDQEMSPEGQMNARPRVVCLAVQPLTAEMSEAGLCGSLSCPEKEITNVVVVFLISK